MKTQFLKFVLPVGLGITLFAMTVAAVMGGCQKQKVCTSGSCMGNDGKCYGPCSAGSSCTTTPIGNCSAPSAGGVYCCAGGGGGGGGCTPTGCPSSAPWKCGAYCYATPPSGNHSCIKCP